MNTYRSRLGTWLNAAFFVALLSSSALNYAQYKGLLVSANNKGGVVGIERNPNHVVINTEFLDAKQKAALYANFEIIE